MLKGKGTNFTWKLQELGTYHEDLQTIEDVRNRCEGATAYYKRLLASSIWDKICVRGGVTTRRWGKAGSLLPVLVHNPTAQGRGKQPQRFDLICRSSTMQTARVALLTMA